MSTSASEYAALKGKEFGLSSPDWKPFWLRRRVLAVFATLFALFAVGISAITGYSAAYNGLVDQGTDEWREYAWKFGPTAILVLVSVFWSRVELQALKYTPWIRLTTCRRQAHADCECNALLSLDYTHTFSPQALIRCIKRRHWLPAAALVISLLLRISIALSTSLLTIATRISSTEIPVRILDSFEPIKFTDMFLENSTVISPHTFEDYRPFYISKAVKDLNISYPFGLRQDIAFQTFELIEDEGVTQATRRASNTTIQTVVQGLAVELDCERSPTCDGPLPRNSMLSAHRLEFPSCQNPLENLKSIWEDIENTYPRNDTNIAWIYIPWDNFADSVGDSTWGEARLGLANCSGLSHQSAYFLLWTAIMGDVEVDNSGHYFEQYDRIIHSCSAVLCAPKITTFPVVATRSGAEQSAELQEGGQRQPFNSDIEPLIRLGVSPIGGTARSRYPVSEGVFNAKGVPTFSAYPYTLHAWAEAFNTSESNNITTGWLENEQLELQLKSLYRQMGPAVAHYSLRASSNATTAMGSVSYAVTRLTAAELTGILIAVLTGISAILAFTLLYSLVPPRGISTRDPGVLLGMATLLDGDFVKLYPPPSKMVKHRIPSQFRIPELVLRTPISSEIPWIIRPYIIGLVAVSTALLIITLVTLLSMSASGGIAVVDLDNHPQLALLWTVLPATLLLILSQYMTACNGLFRSLGSIAQISTLSPSTSLDVSWVDMFGIQVLWRALHTSRFHILSSELLAIVATLLTVFSTLMFTPRQVKSATGEVDLEPTTWFGTSASTRDFDGPPEDLQDFGRSLQMGSLFHFNRTSNDLQFPTGTFGSFVLPTFSDPKQAATNPNADLIVDTDILHLKSLCYEIPSSEFTISIDPLDSFFVSDKELSVFMNLTHPSFLYKDGTQWSFGKKFHGPPPSYYFAERIFTYPPFGDEEKALTEDWMGLHNNTAKRWLWGYISDVYGSGIDFFTVWHCDYSWEAINTTLHLRTRDLSIDTSVHTDPDAAFNSDDTRAWEPAIPLPMMDVYDDEGDSIVHEFGRMGINEIVVNLYPDVDYTNTSRDISTWFRPLLGPGGPLELSDFETAEGSKKVMDVFDKNYKFMAAQYANLFNRLGLNETIPEMPISAPEARRKSVSGRVEVQVWRLYQKPIPTAVIIGILSCIFAANARGLVIILWRRRTRHGKKQAWIEGTDFPSFVPKGVNSVATGVRLWADSNVREWLPADADRMRPNELHGLLTGTRFKLGWFRRRADGERVFAIGVLDPEYWSESDNEDGFDSGSARSG
jgi:hypothetical protein